MSYKRICISSGHGLLVRGAAGIIDEVDEARRVTERLAEALRDRGTEVVTFHDDTSTSQNENLWTITDFHNSQKRELDISVHFNAFEQVEKPMGSEVWYVTQSALAKRLSAAIASVGFIDRGEKYTTSLHFLNQTTMPSVLLEICFVDSQADCDIYLDPDNFDAICEALAAELAGKAEDETVPAFVVSGKVSHFGGPDDMGVSPSEGLAFIYTTADQPDLFLSYQPEGSSGLARRLNPEVPYVACRWPYTSENKSQWREVLLKEMALVEAPSTGKFLKCYPADWGPHEDTKRVADISPGAMEYLGLKTDDSVKVTFPFTHRTEPPQMVYVPPPGAEHVTPVKKKA
jgi:N-acetylmuramoyl-L-alanine amidase